MPQNDSSSKELSPIYSSEQTIILPVDEREQLLATTTGVGLPLSIFSSKLSGLQAIVRYLVARNYSFSEIAALLNRSPKTIWATYEKVKHAPFTYEEESLQIPVALFAKRDLSVLETLVVHLAALGFSNIETARLLNLDPRTTWTVKRRAKLKGVLS